MSSGDGSSARHRVVIVGGGFGGLPAARRFAKSPVEVTLIDRRNHHLFQPLLYQVATGILSTGQIAPALRHILRRHQNTQVELLEVTAIDLERRLVHASAAGSLFTREIPYDSLIVAAGSSQSYFGHDEFSLYAPGMKTIDDAHELRRRIFGTFEVAELIEDSDERAPWLTIAIVGAGPTGVELAGQIREAACRTLRGEFRRIDPASVKVLLVDGGKEPLATFGDNLSVRATKELEKLGVELRMQARVVHVDVDGVDVQLADGTTDRIVARTVIWAAGVEASPLAGELARGCGIETDRTGRIPVLPDLTLPEHPEVFVVGDMASLDNLPGVAEVALQGGLHAANTILRRLNGESTLPFRYRDLGTVATVGRFRAVASVRKLKLSGFPGWVVWLFVHLAFLNGFANRFTAVMSWARSMVGRSRMSLVFSVAHTGGDLSTPSEVLAILEPNPYPVIPSGDVDRN
jgi:NADH:ubiquinone reductase (H+-translocating)